MRERKAKVLATEIVRDAQGKPIIVQDSPLNRYGIKIIQFSVTETEYDQQTLQQFAAKKQSYLAAEQAKAQRQEEQQQRLMIIEKGLRQVAETEAASNLIKKKATVEADKEREVAIINKAKAVTQAQQKVEVAEQERQEAETRKAIAAIKAETADLEKKATVLAAEARAKQIEIGGGLSERDKVLAQIKADRDAKVAAALSTVKTPTVVIVGGKDGQGGDLTSNLMNLMLLKSTGVLAEK
jgi:MarR-like DNA-binding transcriptional regulator SgrR of sgrS sRNA